LNPPPLPPLNPPVPPLNPPAGVGSPAAPTGDQSTTDVAKDQAASVASGAADAAKNVAGVAKEQAGQVASEAKKQVKDLVGQARSELTGQAQVQQERVAGGLHSVGDQLRAMAEGSSEPGPATEIAHQAADKAHQIASWLENRDPGSVLDEVRSFARQRPGAFLALSLGAGILAGRLTRSLSAAATEDTTPSPQPASLSTGPETRALSAGPGYLSADQFSVAGWSSEPGVSR
jgi:hypothetical protein